MKRPKRASKKKRDSRLAIIDAALELFAEQGYSGTSMRQIAKGADVSLGLVTQFYGTKDVLRATVDDHVLQDFGRELASIPVSQNFLETGYRVTAKFIAQHEREYRYIRRALVEGSPGSDDFFKRYHQLQVDLLRRAKKLGAIAEDTDEMWGAFILIFLSLGPIFCMHQVESIVGQSVFDMKLIARRNSVYARLLQQGFGVRK